MKKNRTLRVSALLLALTLITTCFVGGTFAKYTSSTTGSDVATVAKWSFKVNGTEFATTTAKTLTFNLFDTINDTNNTADETDVADNLIAPGTAGSFALVVKNDSEVNAKYTVELTETNAKDVPLQYSVDGNTWKDSIEEVAMTSYTNKAIAMNGATETVTVYWRWVFEGGTGAHAGQTDVTDTALGIAAQTDAPTVIITAKLTATQVD